MRPVKGITAQLGRRCGQTIEVHVHVDASKLDVKELTARVREQIARDERRGGTGGRI